MPTQKWIIVAGALSGACLLLFLNLAGCSSSTDPGEPDPPPTIEFFPVGQGQALKLSEDMVFSAVSEPGAGLSAKWYQSGEVVGEDSVYTFIPAAVGYDTLEVSAFAGAVRDTYYWVIDVQEDVSVIPPEVPNVDAQAGAEPAEVVVSWTRVSGATFPLVEYLVAVSYDGPINESNWDQATILGSYAPHTPIGYSQTYNQVDHGMRPGEQAWFAVRARDDRQQLSHLTSSARHDITWPWHLGGYVIDDVGRPLLGVILKTGTNWEISDNTDGSGFFLFDNPFCNTDSFRVRTGPSTWHDFTTDRISVDLDTTLVNITLINHHGLGSTCLGGDFLEYLRYITRTREPERFRLYTWSEYPVSVFIPPFQNSAGVDMEEACQAAMAFWDSTMNSDANQLGITETPYFVRTTDEAEADIVFLFELRPLIQGYGRVTLLLPAGPEVELGMVVPEKMQIWINTIDSLGNFETVEGVALHEFGHTLGMHVHSVCGVEYLMEAGGGPGAMGRDDPIHLDERRAVRAIRNIPQGANMDNYTP